MAKSFGRLPCSDGSWGNDDSKGGGKGWGGGGGGGNWNGGGGWGGGGDEGWGGNGGGWNGGNGGGKSWGGGGKSWGGGVCPVLKAHAEATGVMALWAQTYKGKGAGTGAIGFKTMEEAQQAPAILNGSVFKGAALYLGLGLIWRQLARRAHDLTGSRICEMPGRCLDPIELRELPGDGGVVEAWAPRETVSSISTDAYLADYVDVALIGAWRRRFPLNRWILQQDATFLFLKEDGAFSGWEVYTSPLRPQPIPSAAPTQSFFTKDPSKGALNGSLKGPGRERPKTALELAIEGDRCGGCGLGMVCRERPKTALELAIEAHPKCGPDPVLLHQESAAELGSSGRSMAATLQEHEALPGRRYAASFPLSGYGRQDPPIADRAGPVSAGVVSRNLEEVFTTIGTAEDAQKGAEQLSEALAAVREARSLCDELGDFEEGEAAAAQQQRVYVDRALDEGSDAAALCRVLGCRKGEAASLATVGDAYHAMKDAAKAVDYHKQALAIFKDMGDKSCVAFAYTKIAEDFRELKSDVKKASANVKQAIVIFQELQKAQEEGQCWHHLARIHSMAGEVDYVLECIKNARMLFQAVKDHASETRAMETLMQVLLDHGRYEEAINLGKDMVTVNHTAGDKEGEARSLMKLAEHLLRNYDWANAEKVASVANLLFKSLRDKEGIEMTQRMKDDFLHIPQPLMIDPGRKKRMQEAYNAFAKDV
ncbi:Tetratricopeptide repeat protein 28 [Symbiodinium microadriaticum]|uniref:Tetratricopeptide repeat protein 28 n=1 Tax=Symbiodinium microadriaticum TaxID=2951 RepID=A0A1Q9D138_SYMMI|nr:Tetratricopeptide repeat protein 28 [Symbiodinium microadriaticum]